MATPLYPGVTISELDLTTVVESALSSIPAFVIRALQGPIEVPTLVTNEQDFREIFGEPFSGTLASGVTFNNLKDWFSVQNYLQYANGAYVVRVEIDSADAAFNAALEFAAVVDNSTDNSINVKDGTDYTTVSGFTADYIGIFAKNPGYWGNDISVAIYITQSDDTATNAGQSGSSWYTYKNANTDFLNFDKYPLYNGGAAGKGEAAIIVYYKDVIKEKFIVSLDPNGKNEFNENYYIEDYLKLNSQYISAYVNNTAGYVGAAASVTKTALANGSLETGDNWEDADVIVGLNKFQNSEDYDIAFLVDGGFNSATVHNQIATICAARKDCFGILGARTTDIINKTNAQAVAALIAYKKTLSISGATSTYVGFFGNVKRLYNKYADNYFWISCSSDVAGLMAQVDNQFFPWYAAAGGVRGVLQNVASLGFNPDDTYVGQLYSYNINTIKFDPAFGTIVNGNRTLQTKPSAFRDINVRRLFTYIENAIANTCKYYLFEFNDELTRSNLSASVNNFMSTIKTNRGVYDFKVVCDETNNTASIIDNNELYLDVYVKPSRVIENITIRFVATRTDANFTELTG